MVVLATCEKMNLEWSDIQGVLKLDERIGQKAYLSPGLGIAGGNLERDLVNTVALSASHGVANENLRAILSTSHFEKQWPLRVLSKELSGIKKPTVAILGLPYKPGTHSLKNAPSLELLEKMTHWDFKIYDPEVSLPSELSARTNISVSSTAEGAVNGSDALVLFTNWQEFQTSGFAIKCIESLRNPLVTDPFGFWKEAVQDCTYPGLRYHNRGGKEVRMPQTEVSERIVSVASLSSENSNLGSRIQENIV